MNKRLIEEIFPVKEISIESSKEKSIRHGHISTSHIWWARRPLASSRSVNYSSLIDSISNNKELEKSLDFIIHFSKWKNSNDKNLINKARKNILEANNGIPPKILDPFSGGGSIPLEALRLGCETYASDYNPVAVFLLKCILEYPQKYRRVKKTDSEFVEHGNSKLISDVLEWSNWVLSESKKELSKFYPEEKDGSTPIGYRWARTIICQNPNCKAEIPMLRQYWLSKKPTKKVALFPFIKNNKINFKIVGDGYDPIPDGFDPSAGNVSRAIVNCQACGTTIDKKSTKKQFMENKSGEMLISVITQKIGKSGKNYRSITKEDLLVYHNCIEYLETKRKKIMQTLGYDPIPTESTPDGNGSGAERGFAIRNYNLNTWGDLFNFRQKLSMVIFCEKIRSAYNKMIEAKYEDEYVKIISSYLAIILDRLADKNSNLVFYNVVGEKIEHVFGRQALPIVWDYVEVNPFTSVGWFNMQDWVKRALENCEQIDNDKIQISQESATSLSYEDNYFDAVITDPPYYDNVPYSHLSDFFYVWLKRSIGHLYPELFSTPLTPKSNEVVTYGNIEGGFDAGKDFFEQMLKKSFQEICRILKPMGISVIVYAHKSTDGWETLIRSILESGLVVTAAWPLHTEMKSRLLAHDTAALASSIYMVARKWEKIPIGFYSDVKKELRTYLAHKLDQLWKEDIAGADFFISAIGSAIEVFGKYEKVLDDAENQIKISKLLDDTREIVTNYAIKQVLHSDFSDQISQMTRFYILWRWAYGEAKVPFDDALKMAQSVGIDIEREWNKGFIVKESENIRIIGPDERDGKNVDSDELIDILHHVLLLWKNKQKEELEKLLKDKKLMNSEIFKRIGQAISESLPDESKEKNWLNGFLTGFRVSDSEKSEQTKLF